MPTSDLGIAATPGFLSVGKLHAVAFVAHQMIKGMILDPSGTAMPGVVICFGSG
jgi:hypothetical protein